MGFKQFLMELEFLSKELNSRHNECDSPQGHKEPDIKNNYCKYCFRHLKYKATNTDQFIQKRYNLSQKNQPYDGALLKKIAQAEIESQKDFDFFYGLSFLRQEQIDEVKSKKEFPWYRKPDIAPCVNQNK